MTKEALIQYVKDRIYDNNDELITGQVEQDVFVTVINNILIPGNATGANLVIWTDGKIYIKSNGLSGTGRFFKFECDDFGNVAMPLPLAGEEPGYSTTATLITYLSSL
jgi:hypothetical protein